MIDALVSGKLYGKPSTRTSAKGTAFGVAKVRTAAGDGEGVFVNVIAFDASAIASLMALDDGDAVALSGTLTPKVWTDKDGQHRPALDMVAHGVISAYNVTRKRKAASKPPPPTRPDFDDGLPT